MPIIKSAIKKMRQDIKRGRANSAKRARLRDLLKTAKKEPLEKNIKAAVSFIDKSAKINLIHKNKAARLKSHLFKFLLRRRSPKETQKGKTASREKRQNLRRPQTSRKTKAS